MKRLSNLKYLPTYLPTYLLIVLLISIPLSIFSTGDKLFDPNQRYVPAQLLIQLAGPIGGGDEKQDGSKDEYLRTGFPEVDALNEQYGVYMAELAWGNDATGSVPESLENCYVFYFPDEELDMEQIAEEYKEAEGCLEAEPNYFRWGIYVNWPYALNSDTETVYSLNDIKTLGRITPNDYYFPEQWALDNPDNDCDIDAPEAWYEIKSLCEGHFQWNPVSIAQLDTASYVISSDVIENLYDYYMWHEPYTCYDFVDNDEDPFCHGEEDFEWHAEPIINIYLANTNNGPEIYSKIASTNWSGGEPDKNYIFTPLALIRVLKKHYYYNQGQEYWIPIGNTRQCVSGMVRCANNNVDIVLMPYGGFDYSAFEDKAAEWLTDNEHDALLIAPAGYPPPFIPFPIPPVIYPAALSEVMSIGAYDSDLNITDDTNSSIIKDIYAPGKDCYTAWAGYYVIPDAHGPAISSAYVAGVAAIYMARYNEGGASTRNALITYSDGSMIYRRLNYYKSFMKTHNEPSLLSNKTSTVEEHNKEKIIKLYQNYPNPVVESTIIPIELNGDTSENVDIRIYDISGRLVKCLNEILQPGINSIIWDAKDDNGSYVKSGIYLLKIESEGYSSSLKIVVSR
ncbi:MAG: S8/S53 family peptidase [bacterium]